MKLDQFVLSTKTLRAEDAFYGFHCHPDQFYGADMMQKRKNYYYFTVRDSLAECEVRVQEYWPENDREKFLDSEFREMYDSKFNGFVL